MKKLYHSYLKLIMLTMVILLTSFNNDSSAQCTASFNWNYAAAPDSSVIQFIDMSSTSPGTIIDWFWDYGDGTSDSSQNPVHSFRFPGIYTVCLTVTTDLGCTDTLCMSVMIPSVGIPFIDIVFFGPDSISSIFCTSPANAQFMLQGQTNGFSTTDSVLIEVNYGDGNDTTFYLWNPQNFFFTQWIYSYANAGTYTAQVIVSGRGVADTMISVPIVVNSNCGPLAGTVYLDNNTDCIFNSGDTPLAGINISLSTGGNIVALTHTDINGVYSFNVPNGPLYEIRVHQNNWYGGNYVVNCPAGGNFIVSTVPSSGNDFYLSCPAGFDLTGTVTLSGIIPGRTGRVCVFAYDRGCNAPSGQIKVILDPMLTALPDSQSSYTISGDTLIWNYTPSQNYWSYCANVMTSTSATLGDTACVTMLLEPVNGDTNPADNTVIQCAPVRTSWDPNDKLAFPEGEGPTNAIRPGTLIDFTIRFQNTGTAEAYDIYILDTLDRNFDLNSFEITGHSHPMSFNILTGDILRFTFNNIMLPDSNTNEPQSHGYVSYRIRPLSGTTHGTVLYNTAGIYFDYNPPVITNTTMHTIDFTLNVNNLTSNSDISIYPNPASDLIHLKWKTSEERKVELVNMQGSVILGLNSVSQMQTVKSNKLASGIYFLRIQSNTGISTHKIIIRR
ncbi:MAG: T9SS C-terminal target domain-containing protein [Bacteroidetes bacterium]|nr:MAG: T9SS C-terminal target domain-containing protein [Bacteroidota bacterium]REK05227.1 MAG: T9SS C-terminal target domain-containing protein [Bacteroidota bacterium]REK32632.1 MAG: T9SS C-terminal target domain-containing protein [Bacteroidota bacterium]REK48921.1 MAG: T9SS C-terminal target domain-containing protein [Bacteroidota bacterium]